MIYTQLTLRFTSFHLLTPFCPIFAYSFIWFYLHLLQASLHTFVGLQSYSLGLYKACFLIFLKSTANSMLSFFMHQYFAFNIFLFHLSCVLLRIHVSRMLLFWAWHTFGFLLLFLLLFSLLVSGAFLEWLNFRMWYYVYVHIWQFICHLITSSIEWREIWQISCI